MSHHLRKEKDCLNCGSTVEDRYCSHCGQENTVPREKFGYIMTHFVTDYLHFDHKFLAAIIPLLFKPGFLTNEYNAGRRARYVHPFRLYIFISIVYFLLAGVVKHLDESVPTEHTASDKTTVATEVLVAENVKEKSIVNEGQKDVAAKHDTISVYRDQQAFLAAEKRDHGVTKFFADRVAAATERGDNIGEKIEESLAHNTPKIIFFMLPVFALFLKLIFRKEKLFYVEHFYHSVHVHSVVFFILMVKTLMSLFLPHSVGHYADLLLLSLPICIYASCLTVYKEGAIISVVKVLMAGMGYLLILGLVTFAIVLLSIASL